MASWNEQVASLCLQCIFLFSPHWKQESIFLLFLFFFQSRYSWCDFKYNWKEKKSCSSATCLHFECYSTALPALLGVAIPEHTRSLDFLTGRFLFIYLLFLCRVILPGKRSIQLYGEWESMLWPGVLANFSFTAAEYGCHLYRWLFRDGLLPNDIYFVGFARSDLTVEGIMRACLPFMKVEAPPCVYAWEAWLCAQKPALKFTLRSPMSRKSFCQCSSGRTPTSEADMMTAALSQSSVITSPPYLEEVKPTDSSTWLCRRPSTSKLARTSALSAWVTSVYLWFSSQQRTPERVLLFNLWWVVFVAQRLEQDNSWEALWPGPPEFTGAVISPVLLIQRGPDLSHWPLPGQRDGAEPHGS